MWDIFNFYGIGYWIVQTTILDTFLKFPVFIVIEKKLVVHLCIRFGCPSICPATTCGCWSSFSKQFLFYFIFLFSSQPYGWQTFFLFHFTRKRLGELFLATKRLPFTFHGRPSISVGFQALGKRNNLSPEAISLIIDIRIHIKLYKTTIISPQPSDNSSYLIEFEWFGERLGFGVVWLALTICVFSSGIVGY